MQPADRLMCSGMEWNPAGPRAKAVAILMSGGVDSSVAAATLSRSGREVVGITMLIPSALGPVQCGVELRACCGTGASEVARQLGIPHYFLDVRDEFRRFVIEPFREAYRTGRTPSPCIDCNTYVKFGAVMDVVHEVLGIEHVATGHYARIAGGGLWAGTDHSKDQSYFLYGIRRERLPHILFPVGAQTKQETREAAASFGLGFSEREESVELCFAGQGDYRAALGDNPDAGPGDVIDLGGRVVGTHPGVSGYTVGQRGGLGIAAGVPLYVVDIDPESNQITVGDRDAASSRHVLARNVNLLVPDLVRPGGRLLGKVRSRTKAAPCTITEADSKQLLVEFDEPEHGVAPGQHLVLYSEDGRVVGGGEITRPIRPAGHLRR